MFRALAFRFLKTVSLSRQIADDIASIELFIDQENIDNKPALNFSKYIFIFWVKF